MRVYIVYCGRAYSGFYIKEVFDSYEKATDYYWEKYRLKKSEWTYDSTHDRYFYDDNINAETSKILSLEKDWYDSFYIICKDVK